MKHCIMAILGCITVFFSKAQNTNNWPVWLDKTFTKTVPYNNQTIVLNNKFGAMEIETWDKKECKVDVVMAVGAYTKDIADNALSLIQIEHTNNTTIEFSTKFSDNNNNNYWEGNKSNSRELSVRYKVYLPATATIIAENSFGALSIGNYNGIAQLTCKYGNLTAGKLAAATKLRIEFGKAIIEEANKIVLIGKYSRIDIGNISNELDAQLDYCQSVDIAVDKSIKTVYINSNYSTIYAALQKNLSANYNISTNNGRFSNSSSYVFEQIKSSNNSYYQPTKKYEGSFGTNKENATLIKIKSNYGSLKFIGS